MRLHQLISRLHAVLLDSENRNLRIAATFEGPSGVQVISLALAQVFFVPSLNAILLHFRPIVTIKKSLDFAAQLQAAINAGELELIGEPEAPDPEDEMSGGLPF